MASSYTFTSRTGRYEVRSYTYTVPSATVPGRSYTVSVDPATGLMECSCPAGQYRRECWHRKAARTGLAGKPEIRIRPVARPVAAQLSDLYA